MQECRPSGRRGGHFKLKGKIIADAHVRTHGRPEISNTHYRTLYHPISYTADVSESLLGIFSNTERLTFGRRCKVKTGWDAVKAMTQSNIGKASKQLKKGSTVAS